MKKIAVLLPLVAVIGLTTSQLYAHPKTSCYTKLTTVKKPSCRSCAPKTVIKRVLVCRNVVHQHGKRYQ